MDTHRRPRKLQQGYPFNTKLLNDIKGDENVFSIPSFMSLQRQQSSERQSFLDKAVPQSKQKKEDKNRAPKLALISLVVIFIYAIVQYLLENQEILSRITNIKHFVKKDTSLSKEADDRVSTNTTNGKDDEEDINGTDLNSPNLDVLGNPIKVSLSNLANIETPLKSNEVPLLWHVPRSGGSTLKDICAFCLGLTQASEVGATIYDPASNENELRIVVDVNTGAKFANVDTTTEVGLARARSFNVAAHPEIDLIVTPYLYLATEEVLNFINKGRMFTLLRHPVQRAISMYFYLQSVGDAKMNVNLGESLERYAKSDLVENNWMTRFLCNKMGGELTAEDEAISREVLRTKALIGLLKKKDESFRRFEKYFGWNKKFHQGSIERKEECVEKLLDWDWSGKNKHENVIEGSEVWNLLVEQNTFDIRLYHYAEQLFDAQGELYFK